MISLKNNFQKYRRFDGDSYKLVNVYHEREFAEEAAENREDNPWSRASDCKVIKKDGKFLLYAN